jgi:hypothetical protein
MPVSKSKTSGSAVETTVKAMTSKDIERMIAQMNEHYRQNLGRLKRISRKCPTCGMEAPFHDKGCWNGLYPKSRKPL